MHCTALYCTVLHDALDTAITPTYLILPAPMECMTHNRPAKLRWVILSLEISKHLLASLVPSQLRAGKACIWNGQFSRGHPLACTIVCCMTVNRCMNSW